jgi:hypothetical protein
LLAQAAYNNSSEVELNADIFEGEVSDHSTQLGEYTLGTKVAKQFDSVWFQGTIRRYDAEDDLYWVLYSDGDSEDLDADEVRKAVQNYKEHMLPAAAVDGDAIDSHSSTDSSIAVVTQSEGIVIEVAQSSTAINHPLPSELVTAIAALTSAAERLTAAAEHLKESHHHHQQQQQLPLQSELLLRQQQQQAHMYMVQQQRIFLHQQQLRLQQQHSRLQQQHVHVVQQQQVWLQQQQQHRVWWQQQQQQRRWYLQWR